jgi:hypothetical protein
MQKFVAVVGILALALTLVPSGLDWMSSALDCCNGIMCPMHAAQGHAPSCDMDGKDPSAMLQPCPVQAANHYTAATIFVLSASLILQNDPPSESSVALVQPFFPNADRRIESPPPRFLLLARS